MIENIKLRVRAIMNLLLLKETKRLADEALMQMKDLNKNYKEEIYKNGNIL